MIQREEQDCVPPTATQDNVPLRDILYIDAAYTLEKVRKRGHEQFYQARHAGRTFRRVWGVHPFADVTGKQSRRIEILHFSPHQATIEGAAAALSLPRWLAPINFVLSQAGLVLLLARLVRTRRLSAIVATDPYYCGLLGLVVKSLTGRPLVVRLYANQDEIYAATGALAMPRLFRHRWIERKVARMVLRRAALVVGGNRNNLDFGAANGAIGLTGVIPNARYMQMIHQTDPARRASATPVFQRLGIPAAAPKMLFIGRLIELKHPDDAIRAMAIAIGSHLGAYGIVAGEGPMREELEELIRSLGVEHNIVLAGLLGQEELSTIIPHCITISPLTGMALIECGLGGSPLIAYDRDWQSEFIDNGIDGFIVPFRDYRSMGRRAAQLIADPELAARFAARIRKRALAYADPDRINAQERALFEKMLTQRARRRAASSSR